MIKTTIGDLLRRHRLQPSFIEKDALTQKELAHLIGCHNSVVSRVERGDQSPTPEYLHRFIEVMHLPPEEVQKIWISYQPDSPSTLSAVVNQIREDWGEALDVVFYGRQTELNQLRQWLLTDRCRLVAVLGLGGIGKTALATTLAKQLKGEFEFVFWRSLRNAPPIADLLAEAIKFFSNQQQTDLPADVSKRITLLLDYFRRQRCLLMLDNLETILRSDRAGYYLKGYEGYGELIQRIGHTEHQSCLLLTSREKPKELTDVYSRTTPIRLLLLGGLPTNEGREILIDMGLSGSEDVLDTIIQRYAGSPLALKLVSATVQALYSGDIAAFLRDATTAVGYIRDPLEQQFERLSAIERDVMYWLAIDREPVSLAELNEDMLPLESLPALLETVEGLHRRSMVETSSGRFTLHPVILEYVTEKLIQRTCEEIATEQIELLQSHALMKATAKDYVRESQMQLILKPVADRLLGKLGKKRFEQELRILLTTLQQVSSESDYAGGNVLNLSIQLESDLSNYDFSHLTIKQAYLPTADLRDVNFAHAELSGSVFTETFDIIVCLALSPNGELIAAATTRGKIIILRASDGKQLQTWEAHPDWVWSITFSPDGKTLASGSIDRTVSLWEVDTGKRLKILSGHSNWVLSVDFNSDGSRLVSGSHDQTVRLWDVHTGHCLRIFQGHTGRVGSVAFSPDNQVIASGSRDQTVRLWDIGSGHCIKFLQEHTDGIVSSVAFSPDGHLLASNGKDGTIQLWDVHTGQCTQILHGHTDLVNVVTFSPDGSVLASGSTDSSLRLWDVNTGICIRTIHGHTSRIRSVVFNPNNILISSSDDQTMRWWDLRTGLCLKTLRGYTNPIWSVAFDPSSDILVSGGEDKLVHLWDTRSGRYLRPLRGHTNRIRSLVFSPKGDILASGSEDQTIKLWNAGTWECIRTLRGHTGETRSVVFSPDGNILISGSTDQTLRLWDVNKGQCLNILREERDRVFSVAINPGGNMCASSTYETVQLWDIITGQCLNILTEPNNRVLSVAFNCDGGLLASAGTDQKIRVWDTQTGQCLKILQGHAETIRSIAFTPNSHILASGSTDWTIRLWDINTGECLRVCQGHTDPVMTVSFSYSGDILVSGSLDQTIKIWNTFTGECLKTLRPDRPYERMNITSVTGLTEAQKASLKALGAIDLND